MAYNLFGVVFVVLVAIQIAKCNELARGWGESINWVSLEEAKRLSASEKKPVMVLIHKTWCGACKSLKPKVAEDDELAKYSSNLIMVNAQDDEEPKEDEYAPGGARYVPRALFLNAHTQTVDASITNTAGNPEYKYFYYSSAHLLDSMKKAVAMARAKREL